MRLAISGSVGFVGREVVRQALAAGLEVLPILMPDSRAGAPGIPRQGGGGEIDFGAGGIAPSLLADIDVCIHLAGRAHVLREPEADPLAEYRRVNLKGTVEFARAAMAAGVKRVIFISW